MEDGNRDRLAIPAGLHPRRGRLVADSVGGQKTEYAYDSHGALYGMVSTRGTDTLLVTGYVRDSLGRITRLVEKVQGVTHEALFTYDTAGRLRTVMRDSVLAATYTYDQNGNRLARVGPSSSAAGTYDDQDRMLTYGGASYAYGANGELRTKVEGTDSSHYTYDALGNLTRVVMPDGTDIEYVIDAQNRRVGKRVNGVLTTGWVYQGQLTPVAELDGAGNVASRFVYATGINVPDYLVRGDSTYRLIRDHLGSVRLVVNVQSGTIAQQIAYDEFGVETQNTNPGFQPFGYAGGLADASTGLMRFGARDYLPEVGRWTAKDPIGFRGGQGNLFAYANSDPVNSIDPNGRIVPLLIAAWAVVEVGLTLYDIYDAIKTAMDPCVSPLMKGVTITGAAAGIISFGGGYGVGGRKVAGEVGGEVAERVPTGFRGRRGEPLMNPSPTPRNLPGEVGGRPYLGHAFDQMQDRGIMPSVVENTIQNGTSFPSRPGTFGYYDPVNDIRVITNSSTGRVVTVIPGAP